MSDVSGPRDGGGPAAGAAGPGRIEPSSRTRGAARPRTDRAYRDAASFRDPSGTVFHRDGVVYRQINEIFAPEWERFLSSGLYEELAGRGLLVRHEEADLGLALDERAWRVIRPARVDFLSYPYEWSFSQLKDAALLTLAVQERAFERGLTLKDASAYNVQFVAGKPILIDSLSFEARTPGTPWAAYRQFCQHFLGPLALMAYRDPRCGLLLREFVDGLPLDLVARLLPFRTRVRLGLAAHVHAHARVQHRGSEADAARASRVRVSDTGQKALLDSLRRTVDGLRWTPAGTAWASYTTRTSYTETAAQTKASLVGELLRDCSSRTVWDVGANTGTFSELAAAAGRQVIALDSDPAAVERLYLRVRSDEVTGVMPLVVDLTNPSPALGWLLRERHSLLERAGEATVLALALVHHLAIANNVPLPEVSEFFAALGSELIVEFVPKDDPQTASLLASRQDVFPDYTLEGFRKAFAPYFDIVREAPIPESRRILFSMRRYQA